MSQAETVAAPSKLREITIDGKEFTLEVPYKDGDTINASEASQLNQVYLENIGNNFRAKVKALVAEGADDATIQKALDEYADSYEFGARRAGGPRKHMDPVEREMRALGKVAVIKHFKSKDMNYNEFTAEQKEEALQVYLKKYDSVVRPIAERRVADAASLGEVSLEG